MRIYQQNMSTAVKPEHVSLPLNNVNIAFTNIFIVLHTIYPRKIDLNQIQLNFSTSLLLSIIFLFSDILSGRNLMYNSWLQDGIFIANYAQTFGIRTGGIKVTRNFQSGGIKTNTVIPKTWINALELTNFEINYFPDRWILFIYSVQG